MNLRTLVLLLLASALPLPLLAQETFVEGRHYTRLDPPAPRQAQGDGVEVVEVFTYGCPACAYLQPILETWKANGGGEGMEWVHIPATFNNHWEMLARVYFTLEALEALDRGHSAMFNALHRDNRQVNTLEQAAEVVEGFGVNPTEFLQVARSFAINSKVTRTRSLLPAYRVTGTPAVIVAGRWVVTGQSAGSYETLPAVVEYLVARERGNP